ncbi:hypothetical protein DPX16_15244 [Anabarilius grahami]|uniref:Uncharacterized protein n=1 Tax=Anabarilius grahami TaxID=495550 RepID=A0A3N0XVG4_ANAGA|nr:hypothetical protein DPX16_15244 [Anabarilius grahami]
MGEKTSTSELKKKKKSLDYRMRQRGVTTERLAGSKYHIEKRAVLALDLFRRRSALRCVASLSTERPRAKANKHSTATSHLLISAGLSDFRYLP